MSTYNPKTVSPEERVRLIKTSQIYGIEDDKGRVIYVGETFWPLKRRLEEHLSNASQEASSPIHIFLRGLRAVDRENQLSVRRLGSFETETEAIEAHSDPPTLNVNEGAVEPRKWTGYGWTKETAALLGEMSDQELADLLGITWQEVRNARVKCGIPPYSRAGRRLLSRKQECEIRERYDKETSYADLAKELDVSTGTIGKVIRKEPPYDNDCRSSEGRV